MWSCVLVLLTMLLVEGSQSVLQNCARHLLVTSLTFRITPHTRAISAITLVLKCSRKSWLRLQRWGTAAEEQLRGYAQHGDQRIREAFKQVPAYLRDLLFAFSQQYTAVAGSYVRLAKRLLADAQYGVLFLSLNYDNLLELKSCSIRHRLGYL